MHPISDKELDKLFQQNFEEAEFQPSEMVWGKITDQMDRKDTKKKSVSVFWMAAASVILVIGAALWFYRPTDVIQLHGGQQQMAQNNAENADVVVEPNAAKQVEPAVKSFTFSTNPVKETYKSTEENIVEQPVVEPIVKPAEVLAANTITPKKVNAPEKVNSLREVKIPAAYTGDQSQLDVTQNDMIASAYMPEEVVVVEPEVASSKKIRSIGSLVNFVIAKVDRRSDKIIEFKDGDEGSEVSGINLGLLKLKGRIR
jgi:hypothetical protein